MLEEVDSRKHFGIFFHYNLSWQHISQVPIIVPRCNPVVWDLFQTWCPGKFFFQSTTL